MHKTNMDAHMKIENRSIVYTAPAATAAVVNTISHQQQQQRSSNKETHHHHFAFSYLKQFTLATLLLSFLYPCHCLSVSINPIIIIINSLWDTWQVLPHWLFVIQVEFF